MVGTAVGLDRLRPKQAAQPGHVLLYRVHALSWRVRPQRIHDLVHRGGPAHVQGEKREYRSLHRRRHRDRLAAPAHLDRSEQRDRYLGLHALTSHALHRGPSGSTTSTARDGREHDSS